MQSEIRCPIDYAAATPAYASGTMRMYRCVQCATAFTYPTPDDTFLEKYYTDFHTGEGDSEGYSQEAKMVRKHCSQLALVRRVTSGNVGRLLDVGCGKGYFLKIAQDSGVLCEGTELSDTGVAYANEALGVTATHGPIELLQHSFGPASFDTVVMWGVIEHVRDPMSVLKAIHYVLKPGGRLFLQTGCGSDWIDRFLPGVNQWYDPPMHLFVFSARGIQEALRRTGFDEVHVDSWYDISLVRRWSRLLRNATAAIALRVVAKVLRLQSGGFTQTRFPLGSEMSAIATKRPRGRA